jgi:peptide deformylase
VGFLQRIIMVDVPGANPRARTQLHVLINPEIVATLTSTGNSPQREGCLSIPGVYEAVARPERITVNYYNRAGEQRQIEADGLLGRAIHHEVEHCDGVSVLDKVSRLKRNLGTKAMKVAKYPTTRSRYLRSDNPLVETAVVFDDKTLLSSEVS